jgi:hypothetical protein
MRIGWIVGSLAALALALPGAAAAATRYAAPSGAAANAPCADPAHPCDAVTAINGAGDGDTISLAAGDYGSDALPIATMLTDNGNRLTIAGAVQQQPSSRVPLRPVLHLANPSSVGFAISGAGTSISDVDIESTSATGALGATPVGPAGSPAIALTRDVIHQGGAGFGACLLDNAVPYVVTDTICAADGLGAQALTTQANDVTLRNVTAYAPHGTGLVASNTAVGNDTITAYNTIFAGDTTDVSLLSSAPGLVTADFTASNYSTVLNPGGNAQVNSGDQQTAEPQFLSGSDLHEAGSSPTVDAGHDDPANGAVDLDGVPRRTGAHTDIGAYEFVPPAATTGPASAVTQTSAIVSGSVNPMGAPVLWEVQYGDSTGYGHRTAPVDAGRGIATVPVTAALTGLIPGITYHYRVVALAADQTTYGADATFQTPAIPVRTAGRLTIRTTRTRVSRSGRLSLKVSCGGGNEDCTGRLTLTARARLAGKGRRRGPLATVRLGRGTFRVKAGAGATLRLRLASAGRRVLSAASHHRVRATAEPTDGSARHVTLTRR